MLARPVSTNLRSLNMQMPPYTHTQREEISELMIIILYLS